MMECIGGAIDLKDIVPKDSMLPESLGLAEKLNRIFDPFFTTKEQGMGIGLCIARTIVAAHHGRIWAENQTAGGAVFRLTLPLSAH